VVQGIDPEFQAPVLKKKKKAKLLVIMVC
jgi:hypothetical protein